MASTENMVASDSAADWAARLDAGPLSPAEQRTFSAWLEADPNNPSRLAGYQRLYQKLSSAVPRLADSGRMVSVEAPVLRPVFRRLAPALAAAAALIITGVWWFNRPEILSTHAAQRQSIQLADGSHLELNAQTSLSVSMRSGSRHIRLEQGEAYFDVAKDPARPFFVETPLGTVRVTGTHFNVRADEASALAVTVVEGSVAVKTDATSSDYALKSHDQLAVVGVTAAVKHLSADAVEDAIAWRTGQAIFDSEPLGLAVARFARYHGREIEITPEAAKLELGGRFKLDELDHFLRDISLTLPVQVLRSPEGGIRIVAR